jgi:ABC-type dipeptide/oligopeptide/nickel transport system permease component
MKNNFSIIILSAFFQVLGIFFITFMILHLLPGDPVQVMLGESAAIADQEKLRVELGLDQPIYKQMINSFVQVMQGDFGNSILTRTPIKERLISAMQNYHQFKFIFYINSPFLFRSIVDVIFIYMVGLVTCKRYGQSFFDSFASIHISTWNAGNCYQDDKELHD